MTFNLRRDERLPLLVFVAVMVFFHTLMLQKFFPLFIDFDEESWRQFLRNYHMSGFDPVSLSVITHWSQAFDIVRHPLLAPMLFPIYLINRLLWWLTGMNCAHLLMALLLLAANMGSFVYLRRTLTDVLRLSPAMANLLVGLFFSMAYVLLSSFVDDHFGLSMPLLIYTVYRSGCLIQQSQTFSRREAFWLTFIVGSITLSNAAIVVIAVGLTSGKRFWHKELLVDGIMKPCLVLLLIGVALQHLSDITQAAPMQGITKQMKWINSGTSRVDVLTENFFGESLQLHREHLLGDVLMKRPVVVHYTHPAQYVVEACLVALLVAGLWRGRRDRFAWLLAAILAFNLLLHIGIGFAIDEVYIMTSHWAFVVPLLMGWLLQPSRWQKAVAGLILLITIWLAAYHTVLLFRYLTWPLMLWG